MLFPDMAVPALARFGSHELKQEFLAPSVAGDIVSCLGVSEAGGGSDVANIKTCAVPKKGTVRDTCNMSTLSHQCWKYIFSYLFIKKPQGVIW